MTDDDRQPPAPDASAKPPTPSPGAEVRRVALPSDPTEPIRLVGARRTGAVPPVTPTTASVPTPPPLGTPTPLAVEAPTAPPAPLSSDQADLALNTESTLVGPQPVPDTARMRVRIESVDDDPELGREATLLPTSRAPETPASTAADDAQYLGNEQTLVGAQAFGGVRTAQPPPDAEQEYLGRDATIIGAPLGAPPAGAKRSETTGGSSLGKKTSPTLDDGWHLKGRQGALTGRTLGDYEIGGILGEGGMGTVYRARQVSLKRRVALKVLPPNLAHDVRLKERFEQEARTASLLNSPNVVQVFAAGSFEDMVYFVMEYVEGTDLSELTRAKQDAKELFTPDECVSFVLQAAQGLAEAGRHGIVHRDIKPANLMITGKNVVKIADFGISKIAGEHQLTMTGTAVGTPAYCSPEQGRGDPVDARADIYSLGVVFYELLTGKKPFEGATANALIYQHNYAEPRLPIELRADIPESYQAVVLKCLQKDPTRRYQDAGDLVSDLQQVRAGAAPMTALMSAFGTGADEAMRRLGIKQRRLWPYVVAAGLVVALAAGGVLSYTHRAGERQAAVVEVARLRTALSALDKSQPVPKGSDLNLIALAALVPAKDSDLARWQAKMARVVDLQKRLQVLDQDGLPDRATQQSAGSDLVRYEEDVGSAGEDVQRAKAKLDAAGAAIVHDREQLGELDHAVVVTSAQADRLTPTLRQLQGLAGSDDLDARRWEMRIAQSRSRAAGLRNDLAKLDDPHDLVTEARIGQLEQELAALRAILGDQDPAVLGWSAKLTDDRENLGRLRKSLARLDAVDWATTSLQAALKSDLAAYTSLVDSNDPDLKAWSRKIADSAARITGLRKVLARLDRPEPLSVDSQSEYLEQLAAYRALVSPDDGQLQAWNIRLRQEAANLASRREEVGQLEHPELSLVELDGCAKALSELVTLGGISEDQQQVAQRRLQEQRTHIAELRHVLQAHQAVDIVDQPLADAVLKLDRIAGDQDPDVRHWLGRVMVYERLHAALASLDSAAPLPEHVSELMGEYARAVGLQSPEIQRWNAKLLRVADLKQQLAYLDQAVPVQDTAASLVSELLLAVSERDAEAKRWSAKLARVTGLTTSLTTALDGAYVLPAGVIRQSSELVRLVSLQDERVAALATRVAILVGPGRPTWASDYRRDDYGPYAELTITGVTQRFRYVPSGTFIMGSPDDEPGRDHDESRVRVTLTHSFWLADSECTQAFWHTIQASDHSRFPGLERPVERISWDDCTAFCIALSAKVPGLRARLPTEAEWEYACRAGVDGPYPSAQGALTSEKLDSVAWYGADAKSTHGVKARQCNRLGLSDMLGNVWEWCEDRYGAYSPTPVTDPVGHETDQRVARGGSWGDDASRVRAANRAALSPDMHTLYVGMRLAVAVDWPAGQEPILAQPGMSVEEPAASPLRLAGMAGAAAQGSR